MRLRGNQKGVRRLFSKEAINSRRQALSMIDANRPKGISSFKEFS